MREITSRVKDARYTGENRCVPCTVVNLGIAVAVSGGLAMLWRPTAALGLLLICTVLIYLRGYLVPGTPTFTRRYVPDSVLAWFGKAESPDSISKVTHEQSESMVTENTHEGGNPEQALRRLGVIVLDEPANQFRLDTNFRQSWHEQMQTVQSEEYPDRLAELLERDAASLGIQEDNGCIVLVEGTPQLAWPSCSALRALLAAIPELQQRHANWETLDLAVKDQLLSTLLVFLENCPECNGSVEFSQQEANTCCTTGQLATLKCGNCGTRFVEKAV